MSAPISLEAARDGLLPTSEPTDVMSASWVAFECIRLCANEFADQVTGNFAAWVMAGAPTCEGREALGRAPSMPMAAAHRGPLPGDGPGAGEEATARLVGELAALLEQRLGAVVRQAAVPEDARACQRAAEAAAEIRELFAEAGG
jgi:hypothetical protein